MFGVMRTWDTKGIFERAGGASALRQALLAECGSAPELSTMYMWTQRDRIAADWLAECVGVAMKKVPYLTIWDLFRERGSGVPTSAPAVTAVYTGEMDI